MKYRQSDILTRKIGLDACCGALAAILLSGFWLFLFSGCETVRRLPCPAHSIPVQLLPSDRLEVTLVTGETIYFKTWQHDTLTHACVGNGWKLVEHTFDSPPTDQSVDLATITSITYIVRKMNYIGTAALVLLALGICFVIIAFSSPHTNSINIGEIKFDFHI